MSQPSADRIDIHACTKEMDGGRVPHGMRADRFCFERRHRQAGLRHDPAHQVVDAETGERLAAIVQEEAFEALDAPIRIIGALDTPVPYSPPLEEFYLPSEAQIEHAARLLTSY